MLLYVWHFVEESYKLNISGVVKYASKKMTFL